MKFSILLLPAVSTAQLFGFGSHCTAMDVDIYNIGNPTTGALMIVAHSPDIQLLDETEPLSEAAEDFIGVMCTGDDQDDVLTAANFGVDSSDMVCGGEGEGYHVVTFDDDLGGEYVRPTEAYPTIRLSPENADSCSCSNMRISILATSQSVCSLPYEGEDGQYSVSISDSHYHQTTAVWLNSHELQSSSATTHVVAGHVGMICDEPDEPGQDCWARPVAVGGHFDVSLTVAPRDRSILGGSQLLSYLLLNSNIPDSDAQPDLSYTTPTVASKEAFQVVFRPVESSSSNFLSIWVLLMGSHWW